MGEGVRLDGRFVEGRARGFDRQGRRVFFVEPHALFGRGAAIALFSPGGEEVLMTTGLVVRAVGKNAVARRHASPTVEDRQHPGSLGGVREQALGDLRRPLLRDRNTRDGGAEAEDRETHEVLSPGIALRWAIRGAARLGALPSRRAAEATSVCRRRAQEMPRHQRCRRAMRLW